MGTIARMNVALNMDDSGFASGIQRAQQQADSFSKKLGGLGQTMSLAVTAPLVGIAAAAVSSAAGFESSMNVMGQVTGATADQMASLQAQALELGAVTSFSAGEAAEAMLELGKAGLAPQEIMGAIGGTMDLAAAGGLGLADAATITANALNAFQLPAEEAATVANMLAAAANASSADVTDLAAGMQMAGAVFASNGQSINDLAAGMAILANNGIAGSDAGTSLKTMLMRLAAPTDEAAGVMADLGIQVFNADGSMRGFADMVGSLETATAGLTDQQRSMALTTIFGADAIRAATILAENGADGFADMQKAVTKEGSAAATAGARMKGFGGAMEYLKGSIDSFLINAALPFLDSLSGMVRSVADLITMVGELPAPVRNTAIAVGAVLAAAGPVLLIVSKLIPAFQMFGTVLGVIASPMGLVVAAVGALVAVLATDFMGVRTALTGMVDGLLGMAGVDLDGIIDGVKSFGLYIGAVLEDGDSLNDWLTHLPPAIQPVVKEFGDLVATLSSDMSLGEKITTIQTDIGELWTSITALDWGGAWAAFQTWLDDWAAVVAASVQSIDWGGIAATGGEWFGNLKDEVVKRFQSIPWGAAFATAGNAFGMLAGWVVAKIKTIPWGDYFGKAGAIFGALSAWIVYKVKTIDWGTLFGQAGNLFLTLGNWIIYKVKTIDWGALFGTAGDLFWQLKDQVVAKIKEVDWGGAISAIGDFAGGIATPVLEAIRDHDWAGTLATITGFAGNLATAVGTELSKTETADTSDKLMATDIDAAIIAADSEFSTKMSDMVNGWTATIKDTDFTTVTTTWLDSITKSFDEAEWSTLGTNLAKQFNDLFAPAELENDSAISFAGLEDAISEKIAGMDWIKVKDSLAGIDQAFADGLGEFAGAFSGTFTKPQWLTDLMAWGWPQLPETPIEWVNTLLSWVWPTLPDPPVAWLLNLLDWLWPDLPGNPVQWLTTLLDWDWPKFPEMPGWISRLLNWAWPTAPGAPTAAGTGTPAQVNQQGTNYGSGGVPTNLPTPNNQNFDPYTDMDGSSMSGSAMGVGAGAVVINNYGPIGTEIDLQALAYQVAQLLGRRR
jgi:TP901 family phage tail tape measure protein